MVPLAITRVVTSMAGPLPSAAVSRTETSIETSAASPAPHRTAPHRTAKVYRIRTASR